MPTSIYTHYSQLIPGITLRGTKMNIKVFLKCRPTSQILRVKINGLMKPATHGSLGRWQVGSGWVRRF